LGDIVDGLVRLADANCNEAFNFAGTKDVSVLELADKCLGMFGRDVREYVDFTADRPGQVMDEVIDSSKAKRVLGWTPKVSVDEALRKTVKWMKTE
jgi:nucleoside-diphosphate-sugar epimerase